MPDMHSAKQRLRPAPPYNQCLQAALLVEHLRLSTAMDLKLPIIIIDELSEYEVRAHGELNFASGEITGVRYDDHDVVSKGIPALQPDYEFTVGVLRNGAMEVEFRIEVDAVGGKYSVTPSELLELKGRAAKLFAQAPRASSTRH